MDLSLLEWLDDHLQNKSYITGYQPSLNDIKILSKLRVEDQFLFSQSNKHRSYPHITRWANHILSYSEQEHLRFPDAKCTELQKIFKELCLPKQQTESMKDDISKISLTSVSSMAPPLKSNISERGVGDGDCNELAQKLLHLLHDRSSVDTLVVAAELCEDHQKLVGAVKSLLSLGQVVEAEQRTCKRWELTEEGEQIAQYGSHEASVFAAVPDEGIAQFDLMKLIRNAKVGFSKAMSNGWLVLDKMADDGPKIHRKVDHIDDVVCERLKDIQKGKWNTVTDSQLCEYRKRKLLNEITIKAYVVKKGREYTTDISKPETDLTADMLANESWRQKRFKTYNLCSLGAAPLCGHLHPLMKVRSEFRQIFFDMGFSEMATNRYVESSFWNFDALFQPQQHPARDAHDTFFLSDPAESQQFPVDYLDRVSRVHALGGYGSQGYKYKWKLSEAKKNVMRTHTTAVSARQLFEIAQQGFKPSKLFSIDRVFRNETLDATHLAEFHQVEGVVADKGLSLAHVMGLFTEFFRKCGIEKLRFKPAYNPYTEPSMEVFAFHDGLGKWVEIGNSGMFRPEMLLPMGLPEQVSVVGFGLSLERPTMIRYGIENIRDLFGAKINLKMVYENPICRLDKN